MTGRVRRRYRHISDMTRWPLPSAIALLAMTVQQVTGPSLGPWGADQAAVAMPGVLDAQPVASSIY